MEWPLLGLVLCEPTRGEIPIPVEAGRAKEPTEAEVRMITSDKRRLADLRLRLSDISWWMRCTAENIARRSNREDGSPGRFWRGRFKAQVVLDEALLLVCAAYVDLNPVRAAMADTLEQSDYTSRQVHRDKAGSIPSSPRPILERLGLVPDAWCDLVRKFGWLFKRAAGSPDKMAEETNRRGQSWMQCPGRPAFAAPGC